MKFNIKKYYLIVVHIILIILVYHSVNPSYKLSKFFSLFSEAKPDPTYTTNNYFYNTQSNQGLQLSNVFIGDSHIQGLNTSLIMNNSLNFGIGEDTIDGVITRLNQYTKNNTPKSIVLMIGINDIMSNRPIEDINKSIEKLSVSFPSSSEIYWIEILPIDKPITTEHYNPLIQTINQNIAMLCNKLKKCTYIAVSNSLITDGKLSNLFHRGDGMHLNTDGYMHLITHLKSQVN